MSVQITIRGVPEEVRDEIAARAALQRQSSAGISTLRVGTDAIPAPPSARGCKSFAIARKRRALAFTFQHFARPRCGPDVTVVVDASVLVAALIDSGAKGHGRSPQ